MFNEIMAYAIAKNLPMYVAQNVMCRLCGCTGNKTSYILLKETCYLVKMIKDETQVYIKEDDTYPRTVCRNCIDKVHIIQHFRAHCKKTQKVLETMYGENRSTINSKSDTVVQKLQTVQTDLSTCTRNNSIITHNSTLPSTAESERAVVVSDEEEDGDMVEEWLDDEFTESQTYSDCIEIADDGDNVVQTERAATIAVMSTTDANANPYVMLYDDSHTFRSVHVSLREAQMPEDATIVASKVLGRTTKERVQVVAPNQVNKINTTKMIDHVDHSTVEQNIKVSLENVYVKINEGDSGGPMLFRLLANENEQQTLDSSEIERTPLPQTQPEVNVLSKVQNAEQLQQVDQSTIETSSGDKNSEKSESIPFFKRHSRKVIPKQLPEEVQPPDMRVDRSGRVFKSNAHKYVEKISDKKHRCMICEQTFRFPSVVEKHVREHTGERPFVCTVENCGKAFVTGYALMKHSEVHSHFRFMCEVCGRSFRQKYMLRDHMNIHTDGPPKYSCAVCEKRFYTAAAHAGHQFVHAAKRHICEVCGVRFSLHAMLERHRQNRHGTARLQCPRCPRSLRTSYELRQHQRRHDRKGLYECAPCQLRFWTLKGLQQHDRAIHTSTHNNTTTTNTTTTPIP